MFSTDETPSTGGAPGDAPSADEAHSTDEVPSTGESPSADVAPSIDIIARRRNGPGIPVSALVGFLSVIGLLGLIAIGGWSLSGNIKLNTIPVVGEWQAKGKAWRLDLRPDKTVVSSSEGDTEEGVYRVDYFGNLWVTLKSGKIYSANLAPPQNALAPTIQDRFDLVESGSDAVTVFDKLQPSASPAPPK
ncbi:MAG: hypothetical protein FWD08_05720 [Alphaproteobacteria bacterium]|nr:hypothetical protein [Alphaproteobacteria bacterium]